MSSKTKNSVDVPVVKVSAARIEVKAPNTGVTLYVRPNSQGGFKKVGRLLPGEYVGKHSAYHQGLATSQAEIIALKAGLRNWLRIPPDLPFDKFLAGVRDRIQELEGKLESQERYTKTAREERDKAISYAGAAIEKANSLQKILDEKMYQVDAKIAEHIAEVCRDEVAPDLLVGDQTQLATAVGAIIAQLKRSNRRIKDLEKQLKAEAEARANDHRLVTNALNYEEVRANNLAIALEKADMEKREFNEDRLRAWAKREETRGLLLDVLKMGARLAEEIL